MKKLLLLFLAALTTLPLSAFTYTYEGYTLRYNVVDDDAQTCEVAGPLNNWSDPIAGDLVIPAAAKYGAVSYEVVSIGENSFYNCNKLTSVDIPNSVTTIKDGAFFGCYNLERIVIPESITSIGVNVFGNCFYTKEVIFNAVNCISTQSDFPRSIEKLTIGNEVKTIPKRAFINCQALTSVEIPNSVITIGESAFDGCNGLEAVVIGSAVELIGNFAFSCSNLKEITYNAEDCKICGSSTYKAFPSSLERVIIGNGVKSIPDGAFLGCTALTEVIASSLSSWLNIEFKDINANPLSYAKKLIIGDSVVRELIVPKGIERINAYAFNNCEMLTSVRFPSSVKSVGNYAFNGTTGLQRFAFESVADYLGINYDTINAFLSTGNTGQIYINDEPYRQEEEMTWPESLKYIPSYAFYNNSNIRNLIIPADLQSIGEYAFYGADNFSLLTYETNANDNTSKLPPELTEIRPYSFYNTKLKAIEIPNSVTSIGEYAFYNCRKLTSVKISEYATSIGDYAFYDCDGLSAIIIPDHLTSIGNYSFQDCDYLKKVEFGNSVQSIGNFAFSRCYRLKEIVIPSSVIEIGYDVFNTFSLKRVEFKGSPRYIGYNALEFSSSDGDLLIPDANDWCAIEADSYIGRESYNNLYVNGKKVENLVLAPESQTVGKYSFMCAPVKKVRIDADKVAARAFINSTLEALCINVNSIEEGAFSGCRNLNTVYSMTAEPPTVSKFPFEKRSTLYVPIGASAAYKSDSYWRLFSNIVETDFAGIDDIFKADEPSGIGEIVADNESEGFDSEKPYEVFNLSGMRMNGSLENLSQGVYIIRQGRYVKKIAVK